MPTATELPSPRFADPNRCPDCRRSLPTADRTRCPSCGLPLLGQAAADLFSTLQSADRLLLRLRAEVHAPVPASVAPLRPAREWAPPYPSRTPAAPPSPAGERPGTPWTVPGVLLALGALCLLVGAVVFLAVTWAMLGVGGRTAVLVGVTAIAGAATALSARRGLRGGAEALAVVTGAFLALDLAGAYSAGWYGDLSATSALLVGSLVVTVGLATATEALASSRTGRLVAPQALAGVSAVVATGAALARFDHALTTAAVVAVVLFLAAGLVAHRRRLPVLVVGLFTGAAVAWLSLLGGATAQVLESDAGATLAGWADVAPYLWAAALLLLLAAPVPPTPVRRLAVIGAFGLIGLATALAVVTGPDGLLLVAVAGTAVCTGLAVADPGRWTAPAFATSAVGFAAVGMIPGTLTVVGLVSAVARANENARTFGHGVLTTADADVYGFVVGSGWTIPVGVACLVLAVAGFWRERVPDGWTTSLVALPVAALTTLCYLPSLLLVVVVAVALAALHAVAAVRRSTWWGREADVVAAVGWAVAGALAATYHPGPALAVTAVYAGVATVVALRGSELAALAAPLLVAATGAALGWATDWPVDEVALGVVVAVCLHALAVAALGRRGAMDGTTRLCLYGGALAAALPAALVSAAEATPDLAVDRMLAALVVTGGAAGAVAILERSRAAAWLAAALQLSALWLRLADTDVATTEAYSLPLAGVLLVFGAWTLWRQPDTSSTATLLPGLGAALVPTLVVAAADPVSLRAALLAIGCALVLTVGAVARLRAPLLAGALAGAALVVVELAPYHDAVPRWLALTAAGLVLLVSGVRWEHLATAGRRTWGRLAGLR